MPSDVIIKFAVLPAECSVRVEYVNLRVDWDSGHLNWREEICDLHGLVEKVF